MGVLFSACDDLIFLSVGEAPSDFTPERLLYHRGYILHKVVDGLNPGKPSSFEDQSFANQVTYHEKELRRILKGTSASKIFVLSERHRLLRYGVLIRIGRGKHVQWMVSERVRDILEV
jgi:hypothetical protein